jgi:hypothetical protein
MKICKVNHCDKPVRTMKLCAKHYTRFNRHGDPEILLQRPNGTGSYDKRGYYNLSFNGRRISAHRIIAEEAIGHDLPKGAQVHHIDGNNSNNEHSNLVICPSQSYHLLLHKRTKELHNEA